MASTNKTTHYELSQYVGNDKPTYLTDYNGDMLAIDNGIYASQQKADSAYSLADTADGKADTAQTTANTAVTNAGTANTNIGTMANLETTEKSTLVGAINEVNTLVNKFDLSTFTSHGASDVTSSQATFGYVGISTALNSDGSIGKVYGLIDMNVTDGVSKDVAITISVPEITVSDSFVILSAGVAQEQGKTITACNMIVNTNHTVTLSFYSDINGPAKIVLSPCLYFLKDFGDIPQQ